MLDLLENGRYFFIVLTEEINISDIHCLFPVNEHSFPVHRIGAKC